MKKQVCRLSLLPTLPLLVGRAGRKAGPKPRLSRMVNMASPAGTSRCCAFADTFGAPRGDGPRRPPKARLMKEVKG